MKRSQPWKKSPRPIREPGGLIEGREASFIAKLPPHVAPDHGANVAGRTERTKTWSKLHNRQTRASSRCGQQGRRMHLCTRPCWRGHLWHAQEEATRASSWTRARRSRRGHLLGRAREEV